MHPIGRAVRLHDRPELNWLSEVLAVVFNLASQWSSNL
jgi:hypothetical protein